MTNQIPNSLFRLGDAFREATGFPSDARQNDELNLPPLFKEIDQCMHFNPWFTPEFVRLSYKAWGEALSLEKIENWLGHYQIPEGVERKVAIIMAGNLPLVGLHDLICVLASGHRAMVKPSSSDNHLIQAVIRLIQEINPSLGEKIEVTDEVLRGFDAIIATGSNNTSRYFEYYFGKYPSIIRKNRNSVAVITGNETETDLKNIAGDIFSYFGLGCRNVSKVYVPLDYDLADLFPAFKHYGHLADHHKYRNNYEYQKSIFLINKIPHLDNGFLLLRQSESLISPVSVLNFERHSGTEDIFAHLEEIKESLQCVISIDRSSPGAIPPGKGQFPELWDYADGIDTMQFLSSLD